MDDTERYIFFQVTTFVLILTVVGEVTHQAEWLGMFVFLNLINLLQFDAFPPNKQLEFYVWFFSIAAIGCVVYAGIFSDKSALDLALIYQLGGTASYIAIGLNPLPQNNRYQQKPANNITQRKPVVRQAKAQMPQQQPVKDWSRMTARTPEDQALYDLCQKVKQRREKP